MIVSSILSAALLLSGSAGSSAEPEREIARREARRLLNAGLPIVERLLDETGEFSPFGTVMREEGLIQAVGATEGSEPQDTDAIYRELARGLREGAEGGQFKAAATFALVELRVPGQDAPVTAAHVALEHRDGYCVDLYYPIESRGKSSVLGDVIAVARAGSFFDDCEPESEGP